MGSISGKPQEEYFSQGTTMAVRYLAIFLILVLSGCGTDDRGSEADGRSTVVFKHGKLAGDQALFRRLIDRFERENPDIKVKDETLPTSTDEQHQFYVINLEGGSRDFDVLSVDVIWVPEFARAGWLRDISHLFSPHEEKGFFSGPMEAVRYEGSIYAIPWYIDAGILYYRKDLLDKYGFSPPRTWDELVGTAQYITAREQNLYGFVWQGKQYEGLVCNVLEYIRSNGGEVLRNGKPVINSPENRAAIAFMRDLISLYRVTPPLATTLIEESARHIFGNGRALFMRNWPYAWSIYEKQGSLVRGKVGVAPLPAFPQGQSAPTLGGWQLGINRHSRRPEAAEKFVLFLTSPAAQKELALTLGYKPTRKSLYSDADLIARQPFVARLSDVFAMARPRPVSPYYMMMTQVMQPHFSAIISGIKTPGEGLASVDKELEHILRTQR
jgi:multiple sugar transport system substrate-binding protein